MTTKRTLRELTAEANQIEEQLIGTGELTPELEEIMAANKIEMPDKVDSYRYLEKRMEFAEEFYKSEAELFIKAAKACKNLRESLRANLKFNMQRMGKDKIEGHNFYYKFSGTSAKVIVENEEAIDEAYKKQEWKLDTKAIKAAIENGIAIEGARLETSPTLKSFPLGSKKKEKQQ